MVAFTEMEQNFSAHNRNTRRRLDIDKGPDDENASAVLLRFPCEQCHAGMSAWIEETLEPTDRPERVSCKRGTKSARIVFNSRAKCQEFVEKFKEDGPQYTFFDTRNERYETNETKRDVTLNDGEKN